MKYFMIVGLTLLCGCGQVKRIYSAYTGDAAETCVHGVIYYQFTSGSAVGVNPDGTVRRCN